jgi:hypothetical protein
MASACPAIAFNVNLPSFDPTTRAVLGQSDHPGDLSRRSSINISGKTPTFPSRPAC